MGNVLSKGLEALLGDVEAAVDAGLLANVIALATNTASVYFRQAVNDGADPAQVTAMKALFASALNEVAQDFLKEAREELLTHAEQTNDTASANALRLMDGDAGDSN
jgi:hypothetical protein